MPLDPSEEPVDDHLEARLLEHLAHDGHVQRLAHLDAPARHRPLPCRRPSPPSDQQQRVVAHRDGSDRDFGRSHGQPPGASRWCMVSARAVKWCSSKKFFVAR